MKKILLVISVILVLAVVLFVQQKDNEENLNWITSIEEAKDLVKDTDKNILINFTGSDWCGWCIKLDGEVFSKPAFKTFAEENLVLVKLDFPKDKTLVSQEQAAYNNKKAQEFGVRGFPTILLMDSNGKIAGKTGYQRGGVENYIEHINSHF